jgi:hypothetical protein
VWRAGARACGQGPCGAVSPATCDPQRPAPAVKRPRAGTPIAHVFRVGLTRAATKAQCPLMMTVLALLAFVLAANAVVAFAAISKLEERAVPRPR